MRHYDHTVNVLWVMEHFNAAGKYLEAVKSLPKQLEEVIGRNTCTHNIKEEFFSQTCGQMRN